MGDGEDFRARPASEFFADIGDIAAGAPAAPRAVPTGFQFLDDCMGGWRTGLHLIAGGPGSGKSAFALHAANAAAAAGVPVIYVAFEQEMEVVVLRLLCQQTGWELRRALDGAIPAVEVEAACAGRSEVFSRVHLVQANPQLDVATIESRAREVMAQHGTTTALVIVDYLQLWAAGNRSFSEFRHEIAKLTTALRRLAQDLQCPVLAVSSQRRDAQGEPALNSLEGTSDLEYTADTVTFLIHVERALAQRDYGPAEDARLKALSVSINLRKNRFGEPASRVVRFFIANAAFDEETLRRVPAGAAAQPGG